MLSRNEFRAVFEKHDVDDILGALYGLSPKAVGDYVSPLEVKELAKRMVPMASVYMEELYYLRARFKNPVYAKAVTDGIHDSIFEKIDHKNYQGAFYPLLSFRGIRDDQDDVRAFVDSIFKAGDIARISEAVLAEEITGPYNDFAHYGLFCLMMSGQYIDGWKRTPFGNLRQAVPADHIAQYAGIVSPHHTHFLLQLVAGDKTLEPLVSDAMVKDSVVESTRDLPSRMGHFWKILQESDRFSNLLKVVLPEIMQTMLDEQKAKPVRYYYQLIKVVEGTRHAGLLQVMPQGLAATLLEELSAAGQERDLVNYFKTLSADPVFLRLFDPALVGKTAAALATIPEKQAFMQAESPGSRDDYRYKDYIDRRMSALGDLVTTAHKFNLAAQVEPGIFEAAAKAVYESGTSLNSIADLKMAAGTNPAFVEPFVKGAKAASPRGGDIAISAKDFPPALNRPFS